MLNYSELIEIIKKNQSFVITSHVNPDADAIGSEVAFYWGLKQNGKEVRVINTSPTPREIKFIDSDDVVEIYKPKIHDEIIKNADVQLLIDLNQISRVDTMESVFVNNKTTAIYFDHHKDPDNFADYMLIQPDIGSVGEIVFDFFDSTNFCQIDKKMATAIYAAIMTDTGSFRYERTSPKTHMIVAKLLERGIDPKWIYEMLFERGRINRTKILGRALQSMQLDGDGKVCSITVKYSDLIDEKGEESDIEGFVSYTLTIEGVRVGLLFVEFENGFKVSYRSRGMIPINKLAAEFEGGGHLNAGGSRLEEKSLEEYKPKIIAKAVEYLKYDK